MMDVEHLLYTSVNAAHVAQSELTMDYGVQRAIDEVSLLFETSEELDNFAATCRQMGLENFNSVSSDTMIRTGISEGFLVRFEFLTYHEWSKLRIEAMCVLAGQAPLHRERLRMHGSGCVVHASFKCEDMDDYTGWCASWSAVPRVRTANGLEMRAEYRNSYGVFSYWANDTIDHFQRPYFKPRVNLRDTLPVAQPSAG